jgi:trimeric autotransporter adhesin
MKHVTFHLPGFLRRVRIHGGEFDSSARAMNRKEQVRLLQADLRIVRGSTIERKQMSTTIKRVALVAVAALGLGVLSVVPSNAANQGDTLVLSSATGTQETSDTATAGSATATLSFLASAAGDSMSVTASLISFPAGNTALPVFDLVETSTGTIAAKTPGGASQAAGASDSLVQYVSATAAGTTTAKYKVYMNAPSVVGTYVVRLTPAVVAGGGSLNATAQTLAITVTQKAAADTTVSATASTSILNSGETNTATADATDVTGSMTIPTGGNTAAIGTIAVTLKNAAGTTRTSESYTAQVLSGPGLLGSGAAGDGTTFAAVGRAITVKAGDVVGIFPDGSSGVSKIEVRTAAGVLIGTETVTFHGAIARIAATLAKPVIGTSGSTAAVITAVAYDAAGTIVSSGNLFANSATTTVAASVGSTAISGGKATFALTGLVAGTTAITVANAATSATVSATPVTVRVGSSTPASITVAMDKSSYAPGEAVTASITVLDKDGLAVADGVYNNIFATGGISANYTIAGWSDTTTVTTTSGVGTRTGFLPSTEGDVKFSWTTGTNLATANQAVAGSATVSVSSPAAAAATDAANEATDAANAATDAALAAAEAADAATTAAQEASDAVAALSESVTKLIAGLQAQIKSLAAVVAKIAKKVKA